MCVSSICELNTTIMQLMEEMNENVYKYIFMCINYLVIKAVEMFCVMRSYVMLMV